MKALFSVPDPSARICRGAPFGRRQALTLDHLTCPGWPCSDGSGRERREAVPLPLACHTPLHPQALCHFASSRQHPHRMRPLGSTATAKRDPGEAQHKGCSLMRQLAPVKRPDKNKRNGRGSTDGGEEVWPFSLSTLLIICIENCTYS